MTTELAFVLCTVIFLIAALTTVMGIPLYMFMKQDKLNAAQKPAKSPETTAIYIRQSHMIVENVQPSIGM